MQRSESASDRAITDIAEVRRHNMRAILRVVEQSGQASRADIARVSGLSQPTVCAAVDGLIEAGLLSVAGEGSSTGGRPPLMLELNAERQYSVGVDLGGTNLRVGIADLAGNIVFRCEWPSPGRLGTKGDPAVAFIGDAIRRTVEQWGLGLSRVGAIGLGAPGVTDPATGVVSIAPAFEWQDTPVAAILHDIFKVPVRVDNDVNAATIAELHYGCGQELRDFVFVSIGTGVGAGIVIDGRLHRGATGAAGEIGYLVIDHTWQGSTIYDFGCFETMAASGAILAMAAQAMGDPDATPEDLFRAAGEGHSQAGQTVRAIANRIAAAFSSIAALIDPQAIVLGGGISGAGEVLFRPVRERLAELSPFVPQLRASRLGTNAGLVGAAVLAIEEIKERALQNI